MMKNRGTEQQDERDRDRDETVGRSLDKQGGETFNPRSGEDPGLLELTEDPRERRLKRHTM